MSLKDDIYQRALTARVTPLVFHPERQPEKRPSYYIPTGLNLIDDAVHKMRLPIFYDVKADGDPNNPYIDRFDLNIHLLTPEAFSSHSSYAHSVVHEHMHATGGKLNRADPYSGKTTTHLKRPILETSTEELVADMATAMVLAETELWPQQLEEVSQYVAAWLPRSKAYRAAMPPADGFLSLLLGDVVDDFGQPKRPSTGKEQRAWDNVFNSCWDEAKKARDYFLGA